MYYKDSISIDSYEWPLRGHFIRVTYIHGKNPRAWDMHYSCIIFTSYHLVIFVNTRYVRLPYLGTNEVKRYPVHY